MPSREASEAQEHMGKDKIRNGDSDSGLRTGQAIQPKEQWRHAEVCRLCGKAAWRPKHEARWQCHDRSPSLQESRLKVKAVLPYPIINDDGMTGTRLSGVSQSKKRLVTVNS